MLALSTAPAEREAIRFPDRALTYAELGRAVTALAGRLTGADRVAVWAEPALETCVAVSAALAAGIPAVPVNPKSGERELGHIAADSAPSLVLARAAAELPAALTGISRELVDVDELAAAASRTPERPAHEHPEAPALIVYTSGTTGPPKGVVLPRRAITASLDALADAWEWTADDVLAHGLPLFHVHGLVLGVLGPLRLGGTVRHLGAFSPEAVTDAFEAGATMLFGVPTMYHRLAGAAEREPRLAEALGRARLLVAGSAALSSADHERIERCSGQRVIERYGMTETLMICSMRADGDRRPGTVGRPLPGVELKLTTEDGATIEGGDDETVGEIHTRGPNLFLEYLNRPEATAEAMRDGWFRTGDVATRETDGSIRLIGRLATDLIKSGGYKIGAGEIEAVLLEHPGVAEAAVTGEPDPDLGERIVAWIVPAGAPPAPKELSEHVARLLAPHKRPREVRFLDALPRNDMGKVTKATLGR